MRCPAPFAGRRYLEKLTYMQHYGAPTRLLDITANPLVALYFACAAEPDCDGKVIVFCVEAADVAYASSDRVQMLSHLPELSHADQRHLEALSYRYMLRPGKFPQKSNQKYDDAVLERLYYDIQKENNAFTRDIRPFDLLRPVFVQSNQDNPRILRQDGAFLLSGLDTDEADSDPEAPQACAQGAADPGRLQGGHRAAARTGQHPSGLPLPGAGHCGAVSAQKIKPYRPRISSGSAAGMAFSVFQKRRVSCARWVMAP